MPDSSMTLVVDDPPLLKFLAKSLFIANLSQGRSSNLTPQKKRIKSNEHDLIVNSVGLNFADCYYIFYTRGRCCIDCEKNSLIFVFWKKFCYFCGLLWHKHQVFVAESMSSIHILPEFTKKFKKFI